MALTLRNWFNDPFFTEDVFSPVAPSSMERRFKNDMRRIMKDFEHETNKLLNDWSLDHPQIQHQNWLMTPSVGACDVHETNTEFAFALEVPGFKKSEIGINVKDNVLTISGERHKEDKVEHEKYHRRETNAMKFTRSFALPADKVDLEKIHARLGDDGILHVTVPKVYQEPKVEKRSIPIE